MTKVDAMLAELQSQVLTISTRAASLAGELADRDERIAGLHKQNMEQAQELEALKGNNAKTTDTPALAAVG